MATIHGAKREGFFSVYTQDGQISYGQNFKTFIGARNAAQMAVKHSPDSLILDVHEYIAIAPEDNTTGKFVMFSVIRETVQS